MKKTLPIALSTDTGMVDTAGFMVLGSLYAAHITGNFVMSGAALPAVAAGRNSSVANMSVFLPK